MTDQSERYRDGREHVSVAPIGLDRKSFRLRAAILEMVRETGDGHIGSAFSCLEIVRVLYEEILYREFANRQAPDRDRFIFSKGHGCLALYAVLCDMGLLPKDAIRSVGRLGAGLGGHPERSTAWGIEATTGSLGHGLAIGVGCALAARIARRPYHTYVLLGDGELAEGAIWEAAFHAAKHCLSNLTVLIDRNRMQCNGPTRDVLELRIEELWRAAGWELVTVDGHDRNGLCEVLRDRDVSRRAPRAIVCNTVKGRGLSRAEGVPEWHHRIGMTQEEISELCLELLVQAELAYGVADQ